MTLQRIDYIPVGTETVGMSVATTLSSGSATTVRIWLRSVSTIADSTTYVSDNNLESEVISRAGLDEETTFSTYTAVSNSNKGDYYEYVVDATVSS